MHKILFICHGNICRSTMAEFVMKEQVRKAGLDVHVESAALHTDELGNDTYPGTKEVLTKYGIPFTPRRARLATKADYAQFDYIIGMDSYNRRDMMRLFGNDPHEKCSLMLEWAGLPGDVADPWYTGDFETTYADVEAGCIGLLEHLKRSR